ncbi:uncharacterized protein At3g60930, chloroplastic-like [Raphanus sativus]|uniref:Uncharacterized protein At3g60930, chloroplastic-like n=1 Tax=Raphanus sativus TaxID=3726 RepID=A0A9W3CGX8_RAPSA|nr:uncharacterized protein At3g60930, chloroplastic-like [Raphanus sativus]
MSQPKEGSGEIQISSSGARIMKVKQEVGEKMKKDAKKKRAMDQIAARVSKRMKRKDGSSGSVSAGPHSPSLTKSQEIVNLIVQAHGKKDLARACNPDETPETAPEGCFCIHEKYISKCHLRFPLPSLLFDLLDHYELALSQLCPSVIRVINGFITRSKEEGVVVGLTDLMSLLSIKESSSKEGGSGTYYLPCRPGLGIFKFTASDDDWRKKYFYVKIDPSTVPAGRTLRVSWSDASDIKDPAKLSGKLTKALFRKLQFSPSTWGAFTTSRIESARFPNRYNASFPDSVSVAGLEVSEGDSVVSISTGASTYETERTQTNMMTLQPSFRSRGKPAKAASTSRGSDKNQGGSFLSSVKEVLDDGVSAPTKDVNPAEPRVQDVTPHPEVPVVDADLQMDRDPLEIEPPRNKRSRTDQVNRPSRSSSSSSRGGTVGWNFTHSKPGSVLDDPWSLATLMRHLKRTECSLPSINNFTNKEEYVEIAHCMGQLAGAVNRAQLKFEDAVHNAPNAGELAHVTELVKATKMELDQARAHVSYLQAEVERLGSKADIQQGMIESQAIDINVKSRRIAELDAARRIVEQQVWELITSTQDNQRNKEAEVRLAVRKGKREVADAHNKVLASVKEKFAKKKDEVELQIYAQELQANTNLLKDMLENEIQRAEVEYNRLMALMREATAASSRDVPEGDGKETEEGSPTKEDEPVEGDKNVEKSSGDKEGSDLRLF